MKTLSIQNDSRTITNPLSRALSVISTYRFATHIWSLLITIALPGLALIVSSWAVLEGHGDVLNAASWLAGLVFFALALESSHSRAVLLSITGLAHLTIAVLGQVTIPEWGVLSSLVTALWAGYALIEFHTDRK